MGKPGRKGMMEEMNIAQRYADLSAPAFKVLNEMMESEDKADRKWAVEQLGKAYVKMIPQKIGGDEGNPLIVMFDKTFNAVTPETTGDSTE